MRHPALRRPAWIGLLCLGCGNVLGLDELEYRDLPNTTPSGGVCDPGSLAISALNPERVKGDPMPAPPVGDIVADVAFGTPRVRLTDENDGVDCVPAGPEPISPKARHVAYACDVGSRFELRVLDLGGNFAPGDRRVIPDLPAGAAPEAEVLWDGEDAIFVHDARRLTRYDLATQKHESVADFSASLSGAELESMTADATRQLFGFIARLGNSRTYFTWQRASEERVPFTQDDATHVELDGTGQWLVVHAQASKLRLHALAVPSSAPTELGPAQFVPDESLGVVSGGAFVNGLTNGSPTPGTPTVLSRALTAPDQTTSLIDFEPGSDGLVHLGAATDLPGWVAVSRLNASPSALSAEIFLLSDDHRMRRLARHGWGASPIRPTPYLSRNACALVFPSNWGGALANAGNHVFLLDLRAP